MAQKGLHFIYGTRQQAPILAALFTEFKFGSITFEGKPATVLMREDLAKLMIYLTANRLLGAQEAQMILNQVGPTLLTIQQVVDQIRDYDPRGILMGNRSFQVCQGCSIPGQSKVGHFFLPQKDSQPIPGFNYALNRMNDVCVNTGLRADIAVVLVQQVLDAGLPLKSPITSRTERGA